MGAFASAAVTGGILGAITTEMLSTRRNRRDAESEYQLALFELGADLRLLDRRMQETEFFGVSQLIVESVSRIENDLKILYQSILRRRRFSMLRGRRLNKYLSKTQEALVRLSSSLGLDKGKTMTYEEILGIYRCCETFVSLATDRDSGRMGRELAGAIDAFAKRLQEDAEKLKIGIIS